MRPTQVGSAASRAVNEGNQFHWPIVYDRERRLHISIAKATDTGCRLLVTRGFVPARAGCGANLHVRFQERRGPVMARAYSTEFAVALVCALTVWCVGSIHLGEHRGWSVIRIGAARLLPADRLSGTTNNNCIERRSRC